MNVIVLTTGISGSSVITGFLAKSGLWAGDETVYKDNATGTYETYENKKLVVLNESLMREASLDFDPKVRYNKEAREKFDNLYLQIDTQKYIDFMEECELHSPWIWKDPRMLITIGFWKNLIDFSNTKVILLHRNSYEIWKSQTIKRTIFSYRYLKKSEDKTRMEVTRYLEDNDFSFISVEYDNFTQKPLPQIKLINDFIGADLSVKDWNEIFRKTSKISRIKRTVLAYLIYLKNYKQRIK
jgi:hypothetical protein